jgi:ElaB/YqjD/DUF883 family membrane-anchored ribosome-binding protein
MATTTNDTVNKVNGAAKDFKNKSQGLMSTLEDFSHDTGERLGEFASRVSDSASEYVKTSRTYIKENPIKGVAVAAAAGIAVGGLIALAMRKRR